jgi:hypothetical protein
MLRDRVFRLPNAINLKLIVNPSGFGADAVKRMRPSPTIKFKNCSSIPDVIGVRASSSSSIFPAVTDLSRIFAADCDLLPQVA